MKYYPDNVPRRGARNNPTALALVPLVLREHLKNEDPATIYHLDEIKPEHCYIEDVRGLGPVIRCWVGVSTRHESRTSDGEFCQIVAAMILFTLALYQDMQGVPNIRVVTGA